MPQPDVHTTRRDNLARLLNSFVQSELVKGTPAKGVERLFAEQLQMHPSLLSQLKSSRPISDANARQIEVRCKKTKGWLSLAPDESREASYFEQCVGAKRYTPHRLSAAEATLPAQVRAAMDATRGTDVADVIAGLVKRCSGAL